MIVHHPPVSVVVSDVLNILRASVTASVTLRTKISRMAPMGHIVKWSFGAEEPFQQVNISDRL